MTAATTHAVVRFVLVWCLLGSPLGAYTLWIYGKMHDEKWVIGVVESMRRRGKTIDEIAVWVAHANAVVSVSPFLEFMKAVRNMVCWPWVFWKFRALYAMQARVWLRQMLP